MNRYNDGLFSKEAVRQLSLVKLLYNSDNAIEIDKLVYGLGLDRRSIYKTIEELRGITEANRLHVEINVSSKGEYSFVGNKIAYYKLRALIVDKEPMTQLAKAFLKEESVDFLEFCETLFISESTLKRYLRKVNLLLQPLGMKLSIKKGKIHTLGSEADIRYCLVSFFWRAYHGVLWPFDNLHESQVFRTISNLFSGREIVSHGKKRQFSYYLAVFILRAQMGKQISSEELPNYFNTLTYDNKSFDVFAKKFKNTFELPSHELACLFLCLYIFPESHGYIQNTSETLGTIHKYSPKSYESIRNFVFFVKEKYPDFDITAQERTTFLAMTIAGRIFVDIFGSVYFNSSAIGIFSYARIHFPQLLPSIEENIKRFEPELSPNTLKSLTLRYAQAYVMEFPPRDFEPKISILLDTDLPMYVDRLISERLTHLLLYKFNFKWVTPEQKILPDLLLATGQVEEKYWNTPTVFLNAEISKKDAEEIVAACERILEKKRKENISLLLTED